MRVLTMHLCCAVHNRNSASTPAKQVATLLEIPDMHSYKGLGLLQRRELFHRA